jgi:hypothetical protein
LDAKILRMNGFHMYIITYTQIISQVDN